MVEYLDEYLQVQALPDSAGAFNGLQVDSPVPVARILAAVDASQASIDAAVERSADLLLVHHGLFWDGIPPVVGRQWKRLHALLSQNVAVYSAHIPLDCHPDVGNNAVLARTLRLQDLQPAGEYKGVPIGFIGTTDQSLPQFVEKVAKSVGSSPMVIQGGPERVSRVCVVTGGAGSLVNDVKAAGADTFVTGEGNHHSYFDATEGGVNLIYAGHYATETFGVKALAAHIEERFGIPWEFFDHPTGL